MSSKAARVLLDTRRPSEALRVLCSRLDVPAVIGGALYRELVGELGSHEAAARFLADLATQTGRPVALNLPTRGGSTTCLVAPKGWTDEKLRGWAGGMAEHLERLFGPATIRAWGRGR